MYSNYQNSYMIPANSSYNSSSFSNDRLIAGGGFLAPFLLGGLTGAVVAPAFYGRPRPYYYNNYNYYYPYPPYYRPYY